MELYLHSPICLHGMVLSLKKKGTTLPLLYLYPINKRRRWELEGI
jgi:hypothetical protein